VPQGDKCLEDVIVATPSLMKSHEKPLKTLKEAPNSILSFLPVLLIMAYPSYISHLI
jgi:hypothetical protein